MTANGHQTTTPTGRPAAPKYDSYSRWPVVILAAAAYVAIWGGWVELGRMSGFGPVNLLPGITNLEVDLSITLPLGMEVYAAYAMGAWLTKKNIDPAARSFAKWSTFASLAIGMSGQIAYHLLSAAGIEQAPWPVVVGVACVSVAVLGMASMLAHRLHVPAGHEVAEAESPEPVAAVDLGADGFESLVATLDDEDEGAGDQASEPSGRPADRKRRPVTEEERTLIIRLSRDLSERAIARQVKRSRDTVRRVLDDAAAEKPATEPPADSSTLQGWPVGVAA